MKKVLLCSMLFVLSFVVKAQTNNILNGVIKDAETGKGIPDVAIKILSTNLGTVSDENGNYSLKVTQFPITISFSSIGYETRTKKITKRRKNKVIHINLRKSATELSEVVINSNKKHSIQQTYSLNKLGVKNIDAPMVTNSVSSKLIEQRNVTDLGDALKSATGVRPINRYGGFQTFRIRGFNNFVLLIDGVRDERHNMTTSAPSSNIANVERLEVLKGPASVLFGHSALGGVINMVRKKPTFKLKGNANISYGSFDSYTAIAGFGGPISDQLRYRVDFGLTRSQGWRNFGERTNNGSLMLEYTPSPKDKLELFVQINSDKYDTDTGIPVNDDNSLIGGMDIETRYNDPRDYLKHKRSDFQLKYTRNFSSRLKLTNTLSYYDDDIDYFSTELLEVNDTKDSLKRAYPFYFNHQSKTLQNQIDVSYKFNIGTVKNNLLVGNSISSVNWKSYRGEIEGTGKYAMISIKNPTLDQGPIGVTENKVFRRKELTSAFFLQNQIDITEKIKALFGMRYDIFNGSYFNDKIDAQRNFIENTEERNTPARIFTYRGGVVYQPIKEVLSIFGSYSNYFRPTRRLSPEGKVFDPENGYQFESGIKFQKSNKLIATLSSFYILKNNLLERISSSDIRQIGSARSRGFEFDIESEPFDGFYIKYGYAYTDASIKDPGVTVENSIAGNRLPFATKHLTNLWISYELQNSALKGLGLGFGGNHVGNNYTSSANKYELPAYTILDASVSYQIKNIRLAFNANNLTNEIYATDAIYQNQFFFGQERNYSVSLGYKF